MTTTAERFDLSGRVALITGGSRGLGREMALAFAEAGAAVAVASRREEACHAVVAEIEAAGGRAFAAACHMGDWNALEPLVDRVEAALGPLDILVNNAGMSPVAPSSVDTSEALWDKVLDVNLKGPFRLTAVAGSRMAARGRGAILNISSVASLRPTPVTAPYSAAKAGLNALTEAYALEFAPGVRVNAIIAGPFATDISKAWTPEAVKQMEATHALGRVGQPHEIVGAALYLVSDASSFTTGALLKVDGGAP
ncbi:MAG: glucose 1-dehydrogenase [Proteobacteria bacterium]|nr:glucose 1-dehydrogenase [Pseudomonadota bacterium]